MSVKTTRISSNMTLVLALFFPTFWIVFFGLFTLALLFSDQSELPFPAIPYMRWIILAFFLVFFMLIYITLMRLKRVELSATHAYISNYFKTYSYEFKDIEKVKSVNFGLFEILILHLKYKGKFGKKIPFLLKRVQLEHYLKEVGETPFSDLG